MTCDDFSPAVVEGTVEDEAVDEASGLATSRRFADTLWVHNDSGDSARLFALDLAGGTRAELTLEGVSAEDWEDLALGPGEDGQDALFIGDIGDNARARPSVRVLRVPEPDPAAGDGALSDALSVELTWPDGPEDSEALLVDPADGRVYLLSKSWEGRAVLAAAPLPLASGPLEPVAELWFGGEDLPGGTAATGADVSPDRRWLVVRTYTTVWLWPIAEGQPLGEAMLGPACPLPPLSEGQGETVAADPGGVRTLSEGLHQPVYRFELAEAARGPL